MQIRAKVKNLCENNVIWLSWLRIARAKATFRIGMGVRAEWKKKNNMRPSKPMKVTNNTARHPSPKRANRRRRKKWKRMKTKKKKKKNSSTPPPFKKMTPQKKNRLDLFDFLRFRILYAFSLARCHPLFMSHKFSGRNGLIKRCHVQIKCTRDGVIIYYKS